MYWILENNVRIYRLIIIHEQNNPHSRSGWFPNSWWILRF